MNLVLVEHDPSPLKLEVLGVEDWPLQRAVPTRFQRTYDATETCYVVSGRAVITPHGGGEPVSLREGDLVTLMPGLACTWELSGSFSMHHRAG